MLHNAGYRFRLHRRDLPGTPDIVLPRHRIAIFVHGCFWHWHGCPKGRLPKSRQEYWEPKLSRNRERDVEKRAALETAGWTVVEIWECDTRDPTTIDGRLREELHEIEKIRSTMDQVRIKRIGNVLSGSV